MLGISRVLFAENRNYSSNYSYQNISKRSFIWPRILFEEAWNSFFLNDDNRTLGKLITYKSNFLKDYFYPESEILVALSFMKLCHWGDLKKHIDRVYSKYSKDRKNIILGNYIKKSIKTYKGIGLSNKLEEKIFKHLLKNYSYKKNLKIYFEGKKRYPKNKMNMIFRKSLIKFAERIFNKKLAEVDLLFKALSSIRVAYLGKLKKNLYKKIKGKRVLGDIGYLKRNDRQYFWSFNGEFWADEIGDYVFALGSRCRV